MKKLEKWDDKARKRLLTFCDFDEEIADEVTRLLVALTHLRKGIDFYTRNRQVTRPEKQEKNREIKRIVKEITKGIMMSNLFVSGGKNIGVSDAQIIEAAKVNPDLRQAARDLNEYERGSREAKESKQQFHHGIEEVYRRCKADYSPTKKYKEVAYLLNFCEIKNLHSSDFDSDDIRKIISKAS